MNISIIEDEKVAARRLKRMVMEALHGTVDNIEIFTTFEDAVESLEKTPPDLLLLDLNLNGDDGFQILHKLPKSSFQTIVVSANTDRAIEAFELGVLDFIPKPFDADRLLRALNRFTGRINRIKGTTTLVVKNQGRRVFVPISEIQYISGAGDYAELHCENGDIHLYNKSLEKMMLTLPKQFIRVHKSHIIDKNEIYEIKVYGGGKYGIILNSKVELPVSRSRYKELFSKS